nr:S1-like domain-containing RNA-binding protein [Mangrovibacillus cuniculi]
MIEIGKVCTLFVAREVDFGVFLEDDRGESVLLHNNEMTEEVFVDDEVDVFVYLDKEGRLTATMKLPKVQKGRYGWVDVVAEHGEHGVFVNIGLLKDVLVSNDDLPAWHSVWPEAGDRLFVSLKEDQMGRLLAKVATENIVASIARKAPKSMYNQKFVGTVYRCQKVGTYLISDEGYKAFVHYSERQEEPRLGQKVEGRVIDVKDDGTLNVSFLPRKEVKMDDDAEQIYSYLLQRGGQMPYTDKSTPEDIQDRFQLSKASFKRALGRLMKEGKIEQKDGWTRVKENVNN